MIELRDCQKDAVKKMKNGCILCGDVGSGKSRTSLAYYYEQNGGDLYSENYQKMINPKDLYIITTALKRDNMEWEGELTPFFLTNNDDIRIYDNKIVVDSWNNIKKYSGVRNAFFIFDEQRVVGSGVWVKSFLEIAKFNQWVLLSATPGDTWSDYIPVFIANGFYKNRTAFATEHIVWKRMKNFWSVDRYINTGKLIKYRDQILVDILMTRHTVPHDETVYVRFDADLYKLVTRKRWNIYSNKPIESPGEYCQILRKIVNSDESRQAALLELIDDHPKAIIFYNYDYERDILLSLGYPDETVVAEWNGHNHQPVPTSEKWIYLVQYTAGAEGWNCITTDTIIFFSPNYSYKIMKQASGRIDRMNTKFTDLYYYHLKSKSGIDLAIDRAIMQKKKFNERDYGKKIF